ncbi:hypothetical protein TAMA11512_21290 [Selenomonas sp. TAMA-11512]|uniref:CD1375 family protein n=1 Tax=Selenomonas sp. TAMA-11512 TaxID=3095337 RepID=UPI003086CEE4|nr:hypothetical protein TAMA11512_09270 [Selenomonas sp. TAMA-11512]BEU88665.1 hypothetical protein TAMA11512_21290 [Selenomonas sp. TAMA-11512]
MKKQPFMIPIYAELIRLGRYANSEEEKTEGQKVVPAIYREDVAMHLAEHAEG